MIRVYHLVKLVYLMSNNFVFELFNSLSKAIRLFSYKNISPRIITIKKQILRRCRMFKKSRNVKKYSIAVFLVLLSLLVCNISFAAIPRYLSVQAKVTDSEGVLLDESYAVTFRVYSAVTGGTALWSETQTIAISEGILDAVIGTTTAFPSAMTFNTDYWLSIDVNSDGEMSPRIRLTCSPYALNADEIDDIDSLQIVRNDTDNTIDGYLIINGDTTLGDASSDSFTINAATISLGNAATLDLADSSATALNIESGLLNLDTDNSRVGIGTIDPSAKLDIVTGAAGGVGIELNAQDTDQIALDINADQITADVIDIAADAVTSGKVIDITADALTSGSALYIDSDSADITARNIVDIIQNNTAAAGALALRVQQDSAADILQVYDGATEVFEIEDGGNVGIGTTDPSTTLEVIGTVTADGLTMGQDENITLNSETITHDGTDFEFSDNIDTSGSVEVGSSVYWNPGAGVRGKIDWTPLTTDKTVTIPDATGNMCLDSIDNSFTTGQTITGNLDLEVQGELRLQDAADGEYTGWKAPVTITNAGMITMPATAPAAIGDVLTSNAASIPFSAAWKGHNYISGLQGGTTNEYYHLTASDYNELAGWIDDVALADGGDVNLGTGDLTATDLTVSDDFFPSAKGMTIPLPASGVTNPAFNMVDQLTTGMFFHRTGASTGNIENKGGGVVYQAFKILGAGAGDVEIAGGLTSTDTGSFDWSVQTGVNTACTMTCTSAAVFGIDSGGTGLMVGPADATAEECLCAGGS